ncbi:MAG: YraN family protein [Rickettsiales bacterium]
MSLKQKQITYNFGLLAERIASWYLRIKFYQILAIRYKSPFGEIDIIAKQRNKIVFVEVKARKDTSLMDFISVRQQRRISRAAEYYLLKHPKYHLYQISFDAIIMNRFFWPKHFKQCW